MSRITINNTIAEMKTAYLQMGFLNPVIKLNGVILKDGDIVTIDVTSNEDVPSMLSKTEPSSDMAFG